MKLYLEYLNKRLSRAGSIISDIERWIVCAVDFHNAKGEFDLLIFIDNDCYHCRCNATNDGKRYKVDSIRCLHHRLKEVYDEQRVSESLALQFEHAYYPNEGEYEYDSYYDKYRELKDYNDRLYEALPDIGVLGENVFVCGDICRWKAVLYALQRQLGPVKAVDMHDRLNTDSRIIIETAVAKEKIHINDSSATITKFFGADGLEVLLPNDEQSLDSILWFDKTWREIIPENCVSVQLGPVECLWLKIRFEVDVFNNVFFKATDAEGRTKYGPLRLSFGVTLNKINNHPDEPAPVEQSISAVDSTTNPEPQGNQPVDSAQSQLHDSTDSSQEIETPTEAAGSRKLGRLSSAYEPKEVDGKEHYIFDGRLVESGTCIIKKGEIRRYEDIFADYMADMDEMLIEDPYIVMPHQLRNLEEFIKVARSVGCEYINLLQLKKVVLLTSHASFRAENNDRIKLTPEEAQEIQDKKLQSLKNRLKKSGVEFEYSFDDNFHHRKVVFSNGWTAVLDRGLDMFFKPKDEFSPAGCRDNEITFIFGTSPKVVKKKTRKRYGRP